MISILYVDDESNLLEISTHYLEKTGDFTVDTAKSAHEALEKIRTTCYDAIVSNYQMQDMDGIQFLQALRASGDTTPFIIFTGKGREEVVIQAFENGADFYVQKGGEIYSQFAELSHQIKKAVDGRKAEKALKNSESRFRTLFAISPDGIILFDLTGRITFVSPEVLTMFELSSTDEAIGTSVFDWVDPEYHDLVRKGIVQLLDGKIQYAITYRVRRRDGSSFFVEASQGIFPDAGGHPGGFMAIIRDITDRRNAEMRLRESEENFRKIFEISALGMTLNMPDLRFFLVNPAWISMMGYTEEEFRKMTFRDITHPDDIPRDTKGIEALVAGRIPVYSTEKRYIRKDGSILWGALKVSAVRNPNGKPRYCLAQIEDITDRKLAEESLREANKKLHLLSSITRHDINNQLTTLQGYLTLLEERISDPVSNDYFRRVETAAQRISAMIRFTKTYENIGASAPVWQDIRTLIETAAKEVALGQIRLANDLPSGSEIFTDPLIARVFSNLIDNSVRYGGKITTIRFFGGECNKSYLVVCEDDGVGIPDGNKERIFERGFGENTGLGLFLAREILSITGITIKETGEPGKSARFEITVPKIMYRFTPQQPGQLLEQS